MEIKKQTLSDALLSLSGHSLESASFVEDYVQLRWKRATLMAYTLPTVTRQGTMFKPRESGYAEAIYALEGQKLCGSQVLPGERVELLFSGGSSLGVSLQDDDYTGPEALQFRDLSDALWVA
jgi:hypothetical protein